MMSGWVEQFAAAKKKMELEVHSNVEWFTGGVACECGGRTAAASYEQNSEQ